MKIKSLCTITLLILSLFLLSSCNSANSGDSYYFLANENFANESYEDAINNCELSLENGIKRVTISDVYTLMGRSYLELDLYDNAIESFEKVLELDSNNYKVWGTLGVTYRQNGDPGKAIECYEKAISINPDYAEAYSSLGSLCILEGEPEKAITYFEKAIELDPTIATTHGNMALALAMVGRFDEADESLKQSIVLGYENADVVKDRINKIKANTE